MKIAFGFLLGAVLLCSTGCSDADRTFDFLVSAIEQRYSVHAQRLPFVSLLARATTRGGVKDLQVAEFDEIGNLDAEGFDSMMRSALGSSGSRW